MLIALPHYFSSPATPFKLPLGPVSSKPICHVGRFFFIETQTKLHTHTRQTERNEKKVARAWNEMQRVQLDPATHRALHIAPRNCWESRICILAFPSVSIVCLLFTGREEERELEFYYRLTQFFIIIIGRRWHILTYCARSRRGKNEDEPGNTKTGVLFYRSYDTLPPSRCVPLWICNWLIEVSVALMNVGDASLLYMIVLQNNVLLLYGLMNERSIWPINYPLFSINKRNEIF